MSRALLLAQVCEKVLEDEGVYSAVRISDYAMNLIPLDDDVLTLEKRAVYDEYLAEQKALLEKYQARADWKDDRGFDFYNREMYTQIGGAQYTDYFTHKDRKLCEDNVFRSFK